MITTAEEVLGHPKPHTPDWFSDNEVYIQALLEEKQKVFLRHLQENNAATRASCTEIKAKV